MKIALIGPPGSGKGTCAEILAEELKMLHVSAGRLLRKLEKTKKGEELKKKYWGKGLLVPNKTVSELIKKNIRKRRDIILDGSPRNMEQARQFEKFIKLDKIFYIHISRKVSYERLVGRLQCMKCGEIYHIKNRPPKKDKICDDCKTKLYQREDDKNKKVINKRLRIFEKETRPVLNYYKKKEILIRINGNQKVRKIVREIKEKLS